MFRLLDRYIYLTLPQITNILAQGLPPTVYYNKQLAYNI